MALEKILKNSSGVPTGEYERIAGGTLYADSPIGTILPYGGATAPSGWFLCQGQAISRTDYSELFAVIGTAFGTGDGSTTFNLPDMRESVPKGAGLTGHTVGNHVDADGLAVGEFLDDRLQDYFVGGNLPTYIGGESGIAELGGGDYSYYVGNQRRELTATRRGATTEVKAVGVNYIIKAKMVALPADFLAKVGEVYQEKDLTSAVEGATTVEGALGALSTNKQPKTLETPLTIGGTNQTTVEGALDGLNSNLVKCSRQLTSMGDNGGSVSYHKISVVCGSRPINNTFFLSSRYGEFWVLGSTFANASSKSVRARRIQTGANKITEIKSVFSNDGKTLDIYLKMAAYCTFLKVVAVDDATAELSATIVTITSSDYDAATSDGSFDYTLSASDITSTVTSDSTAPITSGGVYKAIPVMQYNFENGNSIVLSMASTRYRKVCIYNATEYYEFVVHEWGGTIKYHWIVGTALPSTITASYTGYRLTLSSTSQYRIIIEADDGRDAVASYT